LVYSNKQKQQGEWIICVALLVATALMKIDKLQLSSKMTSSSST